MSSSIPSDCVFCDISAGHRSGLRIVGEGDHWLAFFPQAPVTAGHTLVIPKVHTPDLWAALDTRVRQDVMAAIVHVGRAIRQALQPDGLNLITSAGGAAEQTVFHLHLHVVPRWHDDNFASIWPDGAVSDDAALDNAVERISRVLA